MAHVIEMTILTMATKKIRFSIAGAPSPANGTPTNQVSGKSQRVPSPSAYSSPRKIRPQITTPAMTASTKYACQNVDPKKRRPPALAPAGGAAAGR